jgi:hypothetical protein
MASPQWIALRRHRVLILHEYNGIIVKTRPQGTESSARIESPLELFLAMEPSWLVGTKAFTTRTDEIGGNVRLAGEVQSVQLTQHASSCVTHRVFEKRLSTRTPSTPQMFRNLGIQLLGKRPSRDETERRGELDAAGTFVRMASRRSALAGVCAPNARRNARIRFRHIVFCWRTLRRSKWQTLQSREKVEGLHVTSMHYDKNQDKHGFRLSLAFFTPRRLA